jgi:hypothetical protein
MFVAEIFTAVKLRQRVLRYLRSKASMGTQSSERNPLHIRRFQGRIIFQAESREYPTSLNAYCASLRYPHTIIAYFKAQIIIYMQKNFLMRGIGEWPPFATIRNPLHAVVSFLLS